MKTFLARLLLSLAAVFALSSCVTTDPYGYDGGGGGYVEDGYYDSEPTYHSRPSYGYSRPSYYGRPYRGNVYGGVHVSVCRSCGHSPCTCHRTTYRTCSSCGYYPCRCHSGGGGYRGHGGGYRNRSSHADHRDHNRHERQPQRNDDRGDSGDRGNSNGNRIRIKSSEKGVPDGYHKKEWFQKRGIKPSEHKYEREDGTIIRKKKR